MGLLEYQALPDVAHSGVLCTFSNIDQPQNRGKWCGASGHAAWTVHHVQNHTQVTLLGHSPPASQADCRVGPAL